MSALFNLSILLFAITAAGTIAARNAPYEWLALALDLIPFVGAMAVGAVSASRLFMLRTPSIMVWCVSYSCFASALIGALGTAHLVSVLIEISEKPFVYDFRTYSLLQLGLLLIALGSLGVASSNRLKGDNSQILNQMAMVWVVVLWVSIPMIPLQGFAIMFTVLGSLGLVALWLFRNAHARSALAGDIIEEAH